MWLPRSGRIVGILTCWRRTTLLKNSAKFCALWLARNTLKTNVYPHFSQFTNWETLMGVRVFEIPVARTPVMGGGRDPTSTWELFVLI